MITIGGILLFVGFGLGFGYLFIERFRNSKMMIAIISVLGSSGNIVCNDRIWYLIALEFISNHNAQ